MAFDEGRSQYPYRCYKSITPQPRKHTVVVSRRMLRPSTLALQDFSIEPKEATDRR